MRQSYAAHHIDTYEHTATSREGLLTPASGQSRLSLQTLNTAAGKTLSAAWCRASELAQTWSGRLQELRRSPLPAASANGEALAGAGATGELCMLSKCGCAAKLSLAPQSEPSEDL